MSFILKFIDDEHFLFGNKGAVASNKIHIAKAGFNSTTLCGTPMLSTNWAAFDKELVAGCPECLKIYEQTTKG